MDKILKNESRRDEKRKNKRKKKPKNNISTNNRSIQIKIKPIFKCIMCNSSGRFHPPFIPICIRTHTHTRSPII